MFRNGSLSPPLSRVHGFNPVSIGAGREPRAAVTHRSIRVINRRVRNRYRGRVNGAVIQRPAVCPRDEKIAVRIRDRARAEHRTR